MTDRTAHGPAAAHVAHDRCGVGGRAGREHSRVVVVYIGGFGRSGSTLLERVLGQVPGAVAVGEMVHLLERGLVGDEDCGCGVPFHQCAFWSDVGIKAFGGWAHVDGAEWLALKRRVDRNRFIPLLIAPLLPTFRRDLRAHAERLAQLYTAIAEVSGADLVVDSSKQPSTAFVLRRVPRIDLRVIHLVRDSRGVAYSWTKEVARPEIRHGAVLMPRFHPVGAASRWMSYNAWFHLLQAVRTRVTLVRYESFLSAPRRQVTDVLTAAGHPVTDDQLGFLTVDRVHLDGDHSVAGNPMRFRTGTVALRHDEGWRDGLAGRHRRLVTAITAPLLARYGYVGRRADAR